VSTFDVVSSDTSDKTKHKHPQQKCRISV